LSRREAAKKAKDAQSTSPPGSTASQMDYTNGQTEPTSGPTPSDPTNGQTNSTSGPTPSDPMQFDSDSDFEVLDCSNL
jgi:hypothetical protein